MSSLRKYLKRKRYGERAQPSARRKLGLLEKHKDYVERAKKHHEQTAELERLQREAEERNPNEFYFSMEHERTKGGIPISIEKKTTPKEELLLKSKDLTFINHRIRQTTKEVENLKAKLHLLGCPTKNRHIVFVDNEADVEGFNESEFFQTPKELLDRRFNRPRRNQLKNELVMPYSDKSAPEIIEEIDVENERQYEELNARLQTLAKLKSLAHELWLKRELAKQEEHKKETMPDGTRVVKWKKIRK